MLHRPDQLHVSTLDTRKRSTSGTSPPARIVVSWIICKFAWLN